MLGVCLFAAWAARQAETNSPTSFVDASKTSPTYAEDVSKGLTRAADALFEAGADATREAFTQSALAAAAAQMPLIYFLARTNE